MEFIIVFWIILAFLAGFLGSDREIGFLVPFFASIFFTPIVGFIFVFASKTNAKAAFERQMLYNTRKETQSSSDNFTEEIKKLHDLKEKGIISEIEFEEGKKKLLK